MMNIDNYKIANTEGYGLLFNIENKLRIHILNTLNNNVENWWSDFKQRDFYKISKSLKDDDMGWISLGKIQDKIGDEIKVDRKNNIIMHEIFYTNINDLYAIIKHYWEYFKNDFSSKDPQEILYRLKTVRRIRNKVMHSKPISDIELEELKTASAFIDANINSYKEFPESILLKTVLDGLQNELSEHVKIFDQGPPTNNIKCKWYEENQNEWWWESIVFSDIKESINHYYDLIEELNNLIDTINRVGRNRHRIMHFVVENNLKERSTEVYNTIVNF